MLRVVRTQAEQEPRSARALADTPLADIVRCRADQGGWGDGCESPRLMTGLQRCFGDFLGLKHSHARDGV